MKKALIVLAIVITFITSVTVLDYLLAAISAPDSFLLFTGLIGIVVWCLVVYAVFKFLLDKLIN